MSDIQLISALPMNGVKVFWVTAHTLSFSRAAEFLGVTQGAVSKQIKNLETTIGIELFQRHPEVALTDEGLQIFEKLEQPLQHVVEALTEGVQHAVIIDITPELDTSRFQQLVEKFRQKHPNFSVKISYGDERFKLNYNSVILRYGNGQWPYVTSMKVMSENWVVVASPALFGQDRPSSLEMLVDYPLLYERSRGDIWRDYLAEVYGDLVPERELIGFAEPKLLVQAAVAQKGVALAPLDLVRSSLHKCELISLFPAKFDNPWGYYVLYQPHSKHPAMKAFVAFLNRSS